jgi:signal transduction histidine kinase
MVAFLGGLSAAASMVIVEAIALATMVSNDLVMPVLLRIRWLRLAERADLSHLLLAIRRGTIVAVALLGYAYVRLTGESYALAAIGLVSFCAAAQFAPALIGGVLWKGATEKGALAGLACGFLVWIYTLLLPSFARSGWISRAFVDTGVFGWDLLKPYALFGLGGLEPVTHSLIWSLLANITAYVGVSLMSGQSAIERIQAALFVDAFRPAAECAPQHLWRGTVGITELRDLAARFVGRDHANRAFAEWGAARGIDLATRQEADSQLMEMTERLLAGAIGTASARVMVASVTKGETMGLDEVMEILDEASQVIAYSQKLEAATAELQAANERLTELDRLKDDFMSTVTHELRTPLTSIRSFSEILFDSPDLDEAQRQHFLSIIIKESERLTRLINQVLDVAKIESGRMEWRWEDAEPGAVINEAMAATSSLFEDKHVVLDARLAPLAPLLTDRDKLIQVVINLLSNAVKFAPPESGRVRVVLAEAAGGVLITVTDNGPGIPPWARETVFEKFRQVGDMLTAKPQGTGLGLTISKSIVERLGGHIWVEDGDGGGACFALLLPRLSGPPAGL